MPAQVATTTGANVQAMVQKAQSRALPRAETNGDARRSGQDFRALMERLQDRERDGTRLQAARAEAERVIQAQGLAAQPGALARRVG